MQCAGLPGWETALSGSDFTVIMNIAKHRAPTTNVTTVKVRFMILRISGFVGPLWSQRSNHSGLLEPRGTSTVLKESGVRDRIPWSVIP